MKTVLTFVALILALGAAGAAGYGYLERSHETEQLNSTIESLESRLAAAEHKFADFQEQQNKKAADASASPQALEKDMADLREKVAGVNTRVEVLGTQVGALREYDKKSKVQMARLEKAVQISPSGAAGGTVRREDIEDLIEEKIKGRQPMGKEPPLSAVAARLDLEEVERDALEDIIRQKKNELMTLLKTPRADGSSKLDEIADVFIEVLKSGNPEGPEAKKKAMKAYLSLAAEKVPGTEKTYFVEIVRMQQETRDAFKQALSRKQYQAFEALQIENAMDIKIDNDPLGAYIMQRAQAEGVTLPGQGR